MNNLFRMIVVAVLAFITGCAGSRDAAMNTAGSSRQGVFQETVESRNIPGKALLKIDFSVKTFMGRFITSYIKHSDPPYTVTVTIDGQSIVLTDEPVLEELPDDFKENPEAGTGWKYIFRTTLLLEPGKHHVTVAVPLSDVVTEKDLMLKAGLNQLQIRPVYNASSSRHPGYAGFDHGLDTVLLRLNNQEL